MITTEKETIVYRVQDYNYTEANGLIEEERQKAKDEGYSITKQTITERNKKEKGEIVDEWLLVEIKRDYTK